MKKKARSKRPAQRAARALSSAEQGYLDELKRYDQVIAATVAVSLHQHGINADGRGLRAMKIFTRQTVVALSLGKILPRPSSTTNNESVLWDVTSIASFSRNLLEGYLSLHYFGIEAVSAEEAELRFFIAQLHRNVEWYEIRRLTDQNDSSLGQFEVGIPEQKARIKNHPFLPSLTSAQRNRALAGVEVYKTKSDFEKQLHICKHLRRNFRLLSNLVHPLPLSIERIDNDRGRGTGTEPDINYTTMCLVIARRFLAASTVGIADHFSEALASRFEKELAPIRPLCTAD
jgi:hypothetical protein